MEQQILLPCLFTDFVVGRHAKTVAAASKDSLVTVGEGDFFKFLQPVAGGRHSPIKKHLSEPPPK